jgi:transcriptional regulator with XRE-family HTH domain
LAVLVLDGLASAAQNTAVPASVLPEAVYDLLGKRIAQFRIEHGLSQESLGEFAGLTRASIANIEKGRQRVFIHQLFRFAQILNTTASELLPSAAEVMDAQLPQAERAYLQKVKQAAGISEASRSSKPRKLRRTG